MRVECSFLPMVERSASPYGVLRVADEGDEFGGFWAGNERGRSDLQIQTKPLSMPENILHRDVLG